MTIVPAFYTVSEVAVRWRTSARNVHLAIAEQGSPQPS